MTRVFSRRFASAPAAAPVRALGIGGGALAHDPEKPLKQSPTIVTKQDLDNYRDLLDPMLQSFAKDVNENVVIYDPNVEHQKTSELLADAKAIDGCGGPSGCAGWGSPPVEPKTAIEGAASPVRAEAWKHWVNAARGEEIIAEREAGGTKLTNAQVKKETALYQELQELRAQFGAFVKATVDSPAYVVTKGSDYTQMQNYDVQIQRMRNRYRVLTGLEPSNALPPTFEEEGLPWKWILGLATVATVGYVVASSASFARAVKGSPEPAEAA